MILPKLGSVARLKEQLRNTEFARRFTPARKIQIEDAFVIHSFLVENDIRSMICKKEECKYV